MFKLLAMFTFLALMSWVFIGFINLQMYLLAGVTGLGMFVVVWEASKLCADAATYWECMK